MVVRVKYDRSNRVGLCIAYEGQVIGLHMQSPRGPIFLQGAGVAPPPLAPALGLPLISRA